MPTRGLILQGTLDISSALFALTRPSMSTRPVMSPSEAAHAVENWKGRLALGEPQRYPPGAELFAAGVPAREAFLLTKGVAGLHYALPGGQEALLMLTYPGHLINVCTSDPTAPGPISAIAYTPCQAYGLDIQKLQLAAQRDPAVGVLLYGSLQIQLYRYMACLAELLALPPSERLEHHLRELAEALGRDVSNGPLRLLVPLKDDQIAMLLGVSARQFKRVKKQLQQNGRLRLEDNRVFVLPGRNETLFPATSAI